ncbi:MAG: SIS domain-containing protein [Candidatus Thermoplasmatota archaeon]
MNDRKKERILEESVDYILDTIKDSIESPDFRKISVAVDLILSSDNVFIYGSGRSGLVGKTFAMRLMQLGLNSHFIGETTTPAVKSEDCILLVSKTGETQTAIQTARIVNERVPDADIIVLSASPESTLIEFGDVNIIIDIQNGSEDNSLAPLGTVFEDTAIIFLDGIVAVLMEELGEDVEELKKRHPILV